MAIGGGDVAFRTTGDQLFLVHFRSGGDLTPPVLSLPGDLAATATDPAGAVVTYTATATDAVDGARPTTCVPASGSIFPIGRSIVACSATDASGNASAGSFAVTVSRRQPTVVQVSLPTNDLVFDPLSNRLYASVPSRAGALGNRVAALDPRSGAVLSSAFVGSEPGQLALSADGQYLYVALDGAGAVRRVALPDLTPGLQFSLGSDSFFGPYLAEDMEVVPGDPGAVAVSRFNTGVSPRHGGVAIYDDGVKLADETPRHTGSNVIEFGASSSRLYGYNNETTEFGFRRMNVGPSGVATQDATANVIAGFGVDIEFDAGRMYATSGRVIDPEERTLLATFPFSGAGPVEPDSAHSKMFHLRGGTLSEYDADTFTLRQAYPISGISGTPSSLVQVGDTDVAFRTSADQVFLIRFAVDTTAPVLSLPGDLTTDATSPAGAAATWSATATDDVDGAVSVTCSPPSGSTFPIGVTAVSCGAGDSSGNTSSGTFTVTVLGARDQIARLRTELSTVRSATLRTALDTLLRDADEAIAAHRRTRACNKLTAFSNKVQLQSGRKIPAATATKWIADATRIRAVVGC